MADIGDRGDQMTFPACIGLPKGCGGAQVSVRACATSESDE